MLLAICAGLAAVGAAPRAAHAAGQLAIVPLVGTDAKTRKLALSLTRRLTKTLRRTRTGKRARLFPRDKASKLLRCVQQERCLKRLGTSLDLSYIVAGQVARLGKSYHIDLWLLSVERGAIARSGSARARRAKTLHKRVARLGRKIVARLPAPKRAVAKRARDRDSKARRGAARDSLEVIQLPDWMDQEGVAADGPPPLWKKLSFWAWTSGAVTAAALILSGSFGIAALVAQGNAKDATYQGEAAIQQDAAQQNALAANVFLGIGGALAVGSGLLFYLAYRSSDDEPASSDQAALRPDWQLAVMPTTTGSGGGGALLLRGRF